MERLNHIKDIETGDFLLIKSVKDKRKAYYMVKDVEMDKYEKRWGRHIRGVGYVFLGEISRWELPFGSLISLFLYDFIKDKSKFWVNEKCWKLYRLNEKERLKAKDEINKELILQNLE